jgi:hypothetical protein
MLQLQFGSCDCTPRWTTEFASLNVGFRVRAIASDESCPPKTIIAGGYVGSNSFGHIRTWDGEVLASLAVADGPISALAWFDEDGDGPQPASLVAGGRFSLIDGVQASNIAKWDGVSWHPLGAGTNGSVTALAVFDDDARGPHSPILIAGGFFEFAGDQPSKYVSQWDGFSWASLGDGFPVRWGGVRALAVSDMDPEDGKPALYAGGCESTSTDYCGARLAKWSGENWTLLPTGPVLGGPIQSLVVLESPEAISLIAGSLHYVTRWDPWGERSPSSGMS